MVVFKKPVQNLKYIVYFAIAKVDIIWQTGNLQYRYSRQS